MFGCMATAGAMTMLASAPAPARCGAFFAAALSSAEPFEIGEELSKPSFWNTSFADFSNAHRAHGFSATGEGSDSMDSCLDGGVTCFGLPVYETRLAFTDDGAAVSRVELMLYVKAGTEKYIVEKDRDGKWRKFNRRRLEKSMTRADFANVIDTVRAKLTPPGKSPPQKEANKADSQDAKQMSQTWSNGTLPSSTTLVWNYSKPGGKASAFAPGFLRLSIDGPAALAGRKRGIGLKEAKAAHGAKSIVANVVRVRDASSGRGEQGDVFIDNVPMVDQGSKGYCAAATSERVLRYYGLDIDEHGIAQAAGTTAEEGTDGKAMRDSVAAVGKRFKLATIVAYGNLDKSMSERIRGLSKEVEAYNRVAKRLKRKVIERDVYVETHGRSTVYNARSFEAAMEPEVRMELKCRGPLKTKYKKFLTDIHQQIDKGIPLFWGVTLGIFPEKGIPQASGGHMRLVIGYNDRTNEIIYSDSWGRSHEFKRMPADQAFTITNSLMYLKPLH